MNPRALNSVVLLGFTVDDMLLDEISQRSAVLPTQTHRFAWNLVGALRSADVTVSLLSALPVPNFPEYPDIVIRSHSIEERGVSGITLGFVNVLVLKHLTRLHSCLTRGLKFVREQSPDVVVVHGVHTPFLLFARILGHALNVRTCLVMTDPPGLVREVDSRLARGLKAIDRTLVRYLASGFDGVIALTPALADDFAPAVARLILEGFADPQLAEPIGALEEEQDEYVIAYAGGISAEYGVKNLVRAFQSIPGGSLRLDLYGKGSLDPWVLEQSAIDDRIRYRGVLGHKELMVRLRSAALLVNPRPAAQGFVKYSFPSKLLEYLTLGVPVVTTRLSGIPDTYLPHLVLVDDDSVESLARAILEVQSDPRAAWERATRGQRFVVEQKSVLMQGNRIAEFFLSLDPSRETPTKVRA